MEEQQKTVKAHKLVVNNRKTSMVTGVLDVLSFDLNEILLETEQVFFASLFCIKLQKVFVGCCTCIL